MILKMAAASLSCFQSSSPSGARLTPALAELRTSSDASLWVRMGNSRSVDPHSPRLYAPLTRLRPSRTAGRWTALLPARGRSQRPSELDRLAASPPDLFFNLKEKYTGYVCVS